MPEVAAILLAAGESRRMGQLKALLSWEGETLLEHQIKALRAAGATRVIVVLGHQADRLRPLVEGQPRASVALNPDYREGKTTSIKAGVAALGPNLPATLALLNVDQPRSANMICRVLEAHRQSDSLITIPTYRGKGGHPIVLDASLLPELRAIDEATLGLKAVTKRHAAQTLRVEFDAPELLLDLNTPGQYQAAIQSAVP